MKSTNRYLLTGIVALMLCVPAFAQTPESSPLPVTEPLDVGGTILQPGNYLIRVAPTRTDRNTIQVMTQDGQVVATALTVPHYFEPGEEMPNTMFVYYPSGDGAPRALRTWFARHPEASQGGHDIVYAEDRAKQLARLAKSNVVFSTADTYSVITPEATVTTYTPPAAPVVTESTTSVTRSTDLDMTSQSSPRMPNTASRIPMMALLGIASLAAALVIRMRA